MKETKRKFGVEDYNKVKFTIEVHQHVWDGRRKNQRCDDRAIIKYTICRTKKNKDWRKINTASETCGKTSTVRADIQWEFSPKSKRTKGRKILEEIMAKKFLNLKKKKSIDP